MRPIAPLSLVLAATLATTATIASAEIERVSERFERKRVSAGEEVMRVVDCPRGAQLTGGGYALYNLPDDAIPFVVTASYPTDDAWRVEIRNITERPEALTFRVYALCEKG